MALPCFEDTQHVCFEITLVFASLLKRTLACDTGRFIVGGQSVQNGAGVAQASFQGHCLMRDTC